MKKLKLLSLGMAALLTVSMTATSVFADSGWKKKGNGNFIPPGIAKKLFDDCDQVKWAQKAIEKLNIKGILKGVDGKYYPQRAVTKIEALAMTLRIMDWEDEALITKKLPKKYKGEKVNNWAIGYVTIAYEKGILDDVDMMYFKPNEPAKRHEVAKYVIRALGKEDEAEDYMDKDLRFVDATAVPQGSVGYVYLVDKLGIMKGDGKAFNPMGTLTRAEMAVLFSNLDDKVDGEKDENEYTGTVKGIRADKIEIKIGNSVKRFEVSDDVIVYDGRDRIDYSDIDKGDYVIIKVEDDEVVYIEITDEEVEQDKIISRYTGELIGIDDDSSPETITVQIENMKAIFEVIDDVEVYFKNMEGNFNEIKKGDKVTVTVDNKNRAKKIHVDRVLDVDDEEEISGKLTNIDLTGIYHISVNNIRYKLAKDADVVIEDDDADLEDLEIGMDVEIILENGIVTYIYAED
jgi:hypothetical protein